MAVQAEQQTEKQTVLVLSDLFVEYSAQSIYLLFSQFWLRWAQRYFFSSKQRSNAGVVVNSTRRPPSLLGTAGSLGTKASWGAVPHLLGAQCCRSFHFLKMSWSVIWSFPIFKLWLNFKNLCGPNKTNLGFVFFFHSRNQFETSDTCWCRLDGTGPQGISLCGSPGRAVCGGDYCVHLCIQMWKNPR